MVVRKDSMINDFTDLERSALEDFINQAFISDSRSLEGLRWSQISSTNHALQYDCYTEDAFIWLADTLAQVGQL